MKVYSPAVIEALAECLRTVYWYKTDLRSFIVRAGIPEEIVARLDWAPYKRFIVSELLDHLSTNPPTGTQLLGKLIGSVVEQDEKFPHLRRLDDGKRKVEDARRAVRTLKDLLGAVDTVAKAEQAKLEKRTEAQREAAQRKERTETYERLNQEFLRLCAMSEEPRKRGIAFEKLLRNLFVLHDLDPRGSFACAGEQTDGSIRLDGTILLVEAKWTAERTDPGQIRNFSAKVHSKIDSTLGLFISMAGFTEHALNKASDGRMLMILMDGQDLARILQGIDDLVDVLSRKLRHAAEKGHALYRVGSEP